MMIYLFIINKTSITSESLMVGLVWSDFGMCVFKDCLYWLSGRDFTHRLFVFRYNVEVRLKDDDDDEWVVIGKELN